MKKTHRKARNTEMLREYDFSGGARGKYARRYKEGSNVVVLDPDVARMFPDKASVNRTLREHVRAMRRRDKVSQNSRST